MENTVQINRDSSEPADPDSDIDSAAAISSSPIITEAEVGEAIETIRGTFGDWEEANHGANVYAHAILARIYALAPKTVGKAREELIRQVRKHPDIGKGNRWDPYNKKHTTEDLYVTMLLGTKNYRSRKTQWRNTLRKAIEKNVARTEEAFFAFMKKEGGIDGVQPRVSEEEFACGMNVTPIPQQSASAIAEPETVSDKPGQVSDESEKQNQTIASFMAENADWEPLDEELISLYNGMDIEDDLTSGFTLVIAQHRGNGKFLPLGMVGTPSILAKAIESLKAHEKQIEREALADINAEDKAKHKKLWESFQKYLQEPATKRFGQPMSWESFKQERWRGVYGHDDHYRPEMNAPERPAR